MNWTIEAIVNHVKTIENDNGSGTGALLSTFANDFQTLFTENVNYNTLIMSASITPYSGRYLYDLGYNFCRPLSEDSAVVHDTANKYQFMRYHDKLKSSGGINTISERRIFLYNNAPYVYYSAFIGNAAAGEIIDYFYIAYPPYLSAASMKPKVPTRAMIRALQMMLREAKSGYTDKTI
jgi:hypothetical protein